MDHSSGTNLTNTHLLRLAGLSAVLAGTCYVLVGIFHPPNVFASASTTRWEIVHVIACAMCFFGLLGMVGLYARQAAKAGWMGLAGFLLLCAWFAIVMGFSFVEAFVLPHLVSVTPAFVHGWMGMIQRQRQHSQPRSPPDPVDAQRADLHPRRPAVRHRHRPRPHPPAWRRHPAGRRDRLGPPRRSALPGSPAEDRDTSGTRTGVDGIRALV